MRDSTLPSMIQPADATARQGRVGAPTRWLRCAVLALGAVLALASCSSLKLGYNNADTLLVYSLDSYFDLDDAQEKLVKERVRELLAWHRHTQLVAYARFLEDTERKVGNGRVTPEDVLAFQQTLGEKMLRIGEQAAPELARLALTLTPAQVDHFADKLAKDSSKARREFLKIAGKQTLDDRVKTYAERSESWFGSLSKEQLDMVRASLAAQPSNQQWWMDERERRQKDIVLLLRRIVEERPTELIAAAWLREYFAQLALPGDETRRARVMETRRNGAVLTAQLINSTTSQQKATLAKKLRGYSQDFSALASNGGGRG